jgi:pyrroline-5-carboxylate reductase
MARSIIDGACRSGIVDRGSIGVVDPNRTQRAHFDTAFERADEGVHWLERGEGIIVLAVKPQMLAQAAEPVCEALKGHGGSVLAVSILAGTQSHQVHDALGQQTRVVRVMPNTPAAISQGMSAVAAGPDSTEADLDLIERFFGSVGRTIRIEEN